MAAEAAAAASVAEAATDYNMNAWPGPAFGRGQTTTIQAYQIDQFVA